MNVAEMPGWPLAGWLEEHPNGAFVFFHEDGKCSPPLRSYEDVDAWLDAAESEVVQVLRIRHVFDSPEGAIEGLVPPLYPPESDTAA